MTNKANTQYWDQRNTRIFSSVGHWQGGEDVIIEGHSLMNDLMINASLMQVNILNATGKLVARNVADWVETNFMGLSYPDSRIWCNQISAYAGDTKTSVVAAASAAILGADSRAYGGGQTTQSSMTFLQVAYEDYTHGASFAQILQKARIINGKPMIIGFARPIDKDDERLQPYKDSQLRLGLEMGKYLKFAFELSDYLFEHFGLSINSGGYAAAFLLDQGFTPEEGYKIKAFAVIGGAIACYRDLEHSPANSFLPMKCQDIDYIGVAPRELPQ
ncbi:hypothetical protein tinsulaeT_36460 [Thalassotalea insulae]|uniref:Citrate synthase (unknown stereospecificity) n=1 Tax=Thalassotalea insulae TaxID=2056778 RepID=A0ABQ6GWI3_9GAMM|nr:hypothetical protein [Thalassotalea insulae]GLX80306.1 hypothetical protein tinsulaeT_36460 [Thalassotalea insulae]